jgi:nucleoid DNA-binding protein
MTKADLAQMLYPRNGGRTNRDALRLVDLLFDIVKRHLKEGESIHIVGFGTFEVVNRKPRRGRNPVTGEPIQLAGHRALVFRPSRSLRSV